MRKMRSVSMFLAAVLGSAGMAYPQAGKPGAAPSKELQSSPAPKPKSEAEILAEQLAGKDGEQQAQAVATVREGCVRFLGN